MALAKFQCQGDISKVKLLAVFSASSFLIKFKLCLLLLVWTKSHTKCLLWLWHIVDGDNWGVSRLQKFWHRLFLRLSVTKQIQCTLTPTSTRTLVSYERRLSSFICVPSFMSYWKQCHLHCLPLGWYDPFCQRESKVTGVDESYRQRSEGESQCPPPDCPTSTDQNCLKTDCILCTFSYCANISKCMKIQFRLLLSEQVI